MKRGGGFRRVFVGTRFRAAAWYFAALLVLFVLVYLVILEATSHRGY